MATTLSAIAFPSISTGIFAYPIEDAAQIAVSTVNAFVAQNGLLDDVIFCCFSAHDLSVYKSLLS